MKKNVSFCVILFSTLFCFGGVQAHAIDFLDYPTLINNGDVFLNGGVGFGKTLFAKMQCPPLSISVDYALLILALPFSVGAMVAFSSEKGEDFHASNLGLAARIAYHIGWGVDRLDTYALLTLGGIIELTSDTTSGDFWMGVGAGARYFFLPYLGAYLELSIDKLQIISFGVSFKL
jgi:hypothetical protein